MGVPLPWPIYGKNGSILLSSGCMITSADAKALLDVGLYRWLQSAETTGPGERNFAPSRAASKPELPGLKINVERVQITLLGGGDRQHLTFPVGFFGLLPEMSLLIEHPLREGRLIPVDVGQNVIVDMLIGRHVHVFASQILCINKYPMPYLHLAYPNSIKSSLLRNTRRVRLRFRILALLQMDEEVSIPVSILDLSSNGVGLISEYELGEAGLSVGLSFSLVVGKTTHSIHATGAIRSARQLKAQKAYRYGVELLDLSDEQQHAIESFLAGDP